MKSMISYRLVLRVWYSLSKQQQQQQKSSHKQWTCVEHDDPTTSWITHNNTRARTALIKRQFYQKSINHHSPETKITSFFNRSHSRTCAQYVIYIIYTLFETNGEQKKKKSFLNIVLPHKNHRIGTDLIASDDHWNGFLLWNKRIKNAQSERKIE